MTDQLTEQAPALDEARTGSVTVAYVHPTEVTHSWHESIMNLIGWDIAHEQRIVRGGWVAARCYGADGIAGARDVAVRQFLNETDAEWLFWIDTDMGFEPDTIDQLLSVADPVERPIVGALCFAYKQVEHDGMGGWRNAVVPTIYDWTKVEETGETGFLSRQSYPFNSLVRCAGTGSACVLIHRSVFARVAERDPMAARGEFYRRVPNPTAGGQLMGEDLSFCLRAGAAGIPVYVHTGVRTTHFKPIWVGEEDFLAQRVLRELEGQDVDA